MTKEPFTFIFSYGTGRCDGCRRNFKGGYFFLTWQHSEHSNQCIKDFTGLKKLPEVIAFCANCRWDFINRHIGECMILSCAPPLPQALAFIKAKDQIGKEFYKMVEEGKSRDEALKKIISTVEAAFLPPPKRHIEKKRMKKREAEEIDKVEQEMLVKARRKWELRRIAEERGMKTQVPKYTIEELKSMRKESLEKPRELMINDSLKKPKESMINDSLEKPKKKNFFQKFFSRFGVGGVVVGGLAAAVIQFILYGLVAVCGLGVVIYGISLIVRKETLLGLAIIFVLAPIAATIANFVVGIIVAIVFGIGSGGYYLVKAIGRLFSPKKKGREENW